MNLLVVDDIAMNRKLLRVTLEEQGYTILEAGDGVEALQILDRETVDAVISDILMPNMDGFRLCHEIRKSDRFHALPFVIFTSTFTSPADKKLAQTVGADKYLIKPAPIAAILDALREVMNKQTVQPAESAVIVDEADVVRRYSQTLVRKLEKKNIELRDALEMLQLAHEHIRERTAELETTNLELSHTLSELKVLNGLLPICSYCKKIRDDKDYWQSVEGYISQHTDARFTHGICPECYKREDEKAKN